MASPSNTASASTPHGIGNNYPKYDVFINHPAPDIQYTIAGQVYSRLNTHNLSVFLDREALQTGVNLASQIEEALKSAFVHIAIISPGYAESAWCLRQLVQMLESRKTIIPVFYKVCSSELWWPYAQALGKHERQAQYDSHTIEGWRKALSAVAMINGVEMLPYNSDKELLVDKVVEAVVKMFGIPLPASRAYELKGADSHTIALLHPNGANGPHIEMALQQPLVYPMASAYGIGNNVLLFDVSINHRGLDVMRCFVSFLYHRLSAHGLRVFLNRKVLQTGVNLASQKEGAIKLASVHIAIISPGYGESTWCLTELVKLLKSGKIIIPIFYKVYPSEIRPTDGVYAEALRKLERKTRYDSHTLEGWRTALSALAHIRGFELMAYNGDEELLVDKVVEGVVKVFDIHLPASRAHELGGADSDTIHCYIQRMQMVLILRWVYDNHEVIVTASDLILRLMYHNHWKVIITISNLAGMEMIQALNH